MKSKSTKYTVCKAILTVALLAGWCVPASAQLDPLGAQYFNNQYLGNPALAGYGQGLKINAGYRQQWSKIPGSPELQNVTLDYGFNKVGLGLNILNDKTGLQRQSRVVGTYAYHLPINETNQLHFGVSVGFMNQRVDQNELYGDRDDILVGRYNDRKTYVDGDFGAAFTSRGLNIQAALPNLKNLFTNDRIRVADVATFYTAASYKFSISEGGDGIGLEPKVAYRGVKGFDNIWDAGAQMTLANEQVMLMALYHSTESATFGIGMDYKRKYLISGIYTTQTSPLTGYSNGNFEINVRMSIGK